MAFEKVLGEVWCDIRRHKPQFDKEEQHVVGHFVHPNKLFRQTTSSGLHAYLLDRILLGADRLPVRVLCGSHYFDPVEEAS